jgi:hypothetical protein
LEEHLSSKLSHNRVRYRQSSVDCLWLKYEKALTLTFNNLCYIIEGGFSALELSLKLKRKLGSFFVNAYIPCWLLVIFSWLSFGLEREDFQGKVTIGFGCLISLILLKSNKANMKDSNLTALDVYFFFTMLQIICTLVINYLLFKCRLHEVLLIL